MLKQERFLDAYTCREVHDELRICSYTASAERLSGVDGGVGVGVTGPSLHCDSSGRGHSDDTSILRGLGIVALLQCKVLGLSAAGWVSRRQSRRQSCVV